MKSVLYCMLFCTLALAGACSISPSIPAFPGSEAPSGYQAANENELSEFRNIVSKLWAKQPDSCEQFGFVRLKNPRQNLREEVCGPPSGHRDIIKDIILLSDRQEVIIRLDSAIYVNAPYHLEQYFPDIFNVETFTPGVDVQKINGIRYEGRVEWYSVNSLGASISLWSKQAGREPVSLKLERIEIVR